MFDEFYNIDVKIFKVETSNNYSGEAKDIIELCTIKADVQPYGGGLARKEYGLEVNCQLRMYCKNHTDVKEGNYVQIDGKNYSIVYVAPWEMGREAILKSEHSF